MRKHTFFLAIAFAVIIGIYSNADALMLDYPHNVDNGIKCYHCHSGDSEGNDYWYDPYTGSDPDFSTYNWVCYNRCHAGAASTTLNPTHIGPEKKTHSETTTGSNIAGWTTSCTDCHDPHFQEQINWALDSENIYIVKGTYDLATPLATDDLDVWDPDNGLSGRGAPGIGTSTVNVAIPDHLNAIYDPADTANVNWAAKGGKGNDPLTGNPWNTRAGDRSRGLILVADLSKITTTRTFEIIEMVDKGAGNFTMTVKGDLSGIVGNGVEFGVIYGGLLGDTVKTPETYVDAKGVTRNVRLPVKFYSPKKVAGGAGGPVDLTVGTTEPVGMCQVCHTQTAYFDNSTEETVHNSDAGSAECDECHVIVTGGSATTNHATFMADDQSTDLLYNCSDCHAAIVTSPDSGHPTCETCHTASKPEININAFSLAGNPPDTGASVYDALIDASKYANDTQTYAYVDNPADTYGTLGRVQDSLGNFVTDVGFVKIICGECHDAKPQGLSDGIHGGHADTDFGWAGGCDACHSATPGTPTEAVVSVIHKNDCTICHDTATGTNASTEKIGAATNGVDGDATLANGAAVAATPFDPTIYNCTLCHDHTTVNIDASSLGGIHHNNKTDTVVVNADCTTKCHTVSGHEGDHSARISDSLNNCTACHTGTAGAVSGAPVNDLNGKVHDFCTTCHKIDTLTGWNSVLVAAPGTKGVTTMNDISPTITNDGGGTCEQCHTTGWVDFHTGAPGVTHIATVANLADCISSCHIATGGVADISTVLDASDTDRTGWMKHDYCSTCHNASTGVLLDLVTANANGWITAMPNGATTGGTDGGGNCGACHASTYFNNHVHGADTAGYVVHDLTHNITTDVAQADSQPCRNCHLDNTDGSATVLDSWRDYKGEHLGVCATCHSYVDDGNGTPAQTTNDSTIATGTGNTCTTCHTPKLAPATHGGHDSTSFPTLDAVCSGCHDNSVSGTVNQIHGDNCTWCHTSSSGGYGTTTTAPIANGRDGNAVLAATGLATYKNATCLTCHNTADVNVDPVSIGGIHHDNKTDGQSPDCATKCHTVSGHEGDHSTAVAATGICADCHTAGTVNGITTGVDNKLHDNCTSCHKFDTPTAMNGILKTYAEADTRTPDVIISPLPTTGPADCSTCHGAYFPSHQTAATEHADIVYDTANPTPNDETQDTLTPCANCHNDSAGLLATWTDIATEHQTSNCNLCHESIRLYDESGVDLTTTMRQYIAARTADANVSNCRTCHWSNWNNNPSHTTIDHFAQGKVTGDAVCTGCHDQAGVGTNDYFINTIHNASGSGCGTCHVEPAGSGPLVDKSLGGTYASESVNYETINSGLGGSCTTCHVAYGSGFQAAHTVNGQDHLDTGGTVNMVAADANCTTTCHDGSSAANIITNTHGNACTLCHTNTTTDGRLRIGLALKGDATQHTINTSSACRTCHAGTNGTVNYNNFATAHTNGDHLTEALGNVLTGSAACTSCHDGSSAGNIVTNTHNGTCNNCHIDSATNGTLTVGPSATPDGDASGHVVNTPSSCVSCHGGATYLYDSDFQNAHDVKDHIGSDLLTAMLATAAGCSSCHTENTAATIVSGTHKNTCTHCHTNMTTDGALRVGAGGRGDASGHTVDTQSTCAGCHANHNIDWYYHGSGRTPDHSAVNLNSVLWPSAPATRREDCGSASCHNSGVNDRITNIHNLSAALHPAQCNKCHTATGAMQLDAANGNAQMGGPGATCATCHSTGSGHNYFDDHLHTHTVSYNATTDLAQDPGQPCADCHTNNDDAAGTPLDSFTDIIGEHVTGCARCHDYTDGDAQATPPLANLFGGTGAIDNNTNPTECLTCHSPKASTATHGGHDASHFGWSGNCDACHSATPGFPTEAVVSTIHGGNCDLCHTSGSYNATTEKVGDATNGVDGDATLANGAAAAVTPFDPTIYNCTLCHDHTTVNIDASSLGGIHH
ncbi:MAG: cytochrome c3 family protein, partial [Desulfurivibrionaceae bacterium]